MSDSTNKNELKRKRKLRTRRKIFGSTERPRLSLFRSATHIYAQVINDTEGRTLCHVSSFGKKANAGKARASCEKCTELGKKLAEKCKSIGIERVVFDRNGLPYHGRVKSFADGAREGGLDF